MPAPRSIAPERMLITRWIEYNQATQNKNQKQMIEVLNADLGTSMKAWQIIRWKKPKTDSDEERNIKINLVEYFARNGGIAQIFKAYGVSSDKKLANELSTIWYHPEALIRASIQSIPKRMNADMKSIEGHENTVRAIACIHGYVSQYLDLILKSLKIKYDKDALTVKARQAIADEIYSIVGFDFNPMR
jgi:hypothetical protein